MFPVPIRHAFTYKWVTFPFFDYTGHGLTHPQGNIKMPAVFMKMANLDKSIPHVPLLLFSLLPHKPNIPQFMFKWKKCDVSMHGLKELIHQKKLFISL